MKEWLRSPEHLDIAGSLYPSVEQTLCNIFSGDQQEVGTGAGESPNGGVINEAVLCWGIGSGKSVCSSVAVARICYMLGCMRDPATALGLAPGSELVIANVSVNENQAKEVVFKEIGRRLSAPWFTKHFQPDPGIKSVLRLPKNVRVFPGNSQSNKVLGLNVVAFVIDEAAFHGEVKKSAKSYMTADSSDTYSGAVELYSALQERAQSRFGHKWLGFIISSPLYVDDFVNQKLKEFAWGARHMYCEHRAQWDVKPPTAYGPESFWIDPVSKQMYRELPEGYSGKLRRWVR